MQPRVGRNSTAIAETAFGLPAEPKISPFLATLFALLNANAVQYCVLNPLETISDIDADSLELAVHHAQRKSLRRLFCKLPEDGYQPVQCVRAEMDVDRFQFALLAASRPQFIRVDVSYVRTDGPAVKNKMFVRRQWKWNRWVAAPVDEFSHLLTKISRTGVLPIPEEKRLKALVKELGRAHAETVTGQLFGIAAQTYIVEACAIGGLRTKLHQLHLQRSTVRSLRDVVEKGKLLVQNWFKPSGVLITILGPDGAGKTTLSTNIFDALGSGFGPQKLLLWRPEVLPRLAKSPSIDLPHSKPPRGALPSLARLLAIFLDYWVGHFILVKPLLSRCGLILYDRDVHDILVDSRRYRYGGPSWVPSLLTKLLPQAESVFLILDARPEVILERKQEVAPEEVRRQLAGYRDLAPKLPNSHIIRTDGGLEATMSVVARTIVDYLHFRYERRYFQNETREADRSGPMRPSKWTELFRSAYGLYSKRRAWLHKGLLTVLDQALISGSNFFLAILLARQLPAEQYGAYALSFAIFLFFSFIQQGLFLEPMSVFGPSMHRDSQREYLGSLVWLQGALASVLFVLAAVATTTYLRDDTGVFQMPLLGMFLSAPCVLLYWFARRAFYLQLQPGRAVGGALLYCALLSTSIWLLVRTGRLSAFTAFLAMGAAALFTSLHQLRQLRPILFARKAISELRDVAARHWRYGRWAILGSLFIWIPWNVYYPVVAHFSGLAEVAGLRALLNLALPVTQTLSAFTLLFLPHASNVSQQESWPGAKWLALRITAFFALGAMAYWIPVYLFRARLLLFLYAGHYSDVARLIPWIGFSSLLGGMALGPTIAFRAMRSPMTVTFIYFVSSAVTLVFGILATRLYGIPGAVACNLLSNVAAAVLGWRMLARQGRPEAEPSLAGQAVLP